MNKSTRELRNTQLSTYDIFAVFVIGILIFAAQYCIFMVVPNERIMGPVQRIFYFHVASAFACYCSAAVMLGGGLCYLATRNKKYDAWTEAGAEVGFLFCTIVLLSGMIWARPIWNTWFNWEPRLVSFLLLWLIFLALNLLRAFGDKERIASHCAVLAIIGAISIPLVVFSIKLLPQMAQLHPQVLEKNGLKDPRFGYTLALSSIAIISFQFYLISIRARMAQLKQKFIDS